MYPVWSSLAALGIIIIWLASLSFLIWRQNKFLKSLFPQSGARDIRKRFEEVTGSIEAFRGEVSDLGNKLTGYQQQSLQHIQRVAFLRFNPFGDTGGDQSFAVCLLNNEGSGIVITSLHARSGTRLFGKEVIAGKSEKYELSKEEEQVIKKAMTRN